MPKQRDETLALKVWLAQKSSRSHYYRLTAAASVEHEFRKHAGHPSSYALVRFDCAGADALSIAFVADWPADLAPGFVGALEDAITEAVVEVLFAGYFPHRGCAVRLARVGYDAVGSSEVAFQRAAAEAMKELLATARWQLQETVADGASG